MFNLGRAMEILLKYWILSRVLYYEIIDLPVLSGWNVVAAQNHFFFNR